MIASVTVGCLMAGCCVATFQAATAGS
jgi:flagellar biosynthesis protein FliQ